MLFFGKKETLEDLKLKLEKLKSGSYLMRPNEAGQTLDDIQKDVEKKIAKLERKSA